MRRAFMALTLAALIGLPASARAQSKDEISRADSLFHAAKALLESGQYTDACAKFAESKRLAPGIGVTMYLADCYEHIGRTASAWTEFRSAEGLARQRSDKRADLARNHAQALEAKLMRLTISLAPTVPRAGLEVLRDGVPVPAEELDLPVPVDPGEHAVVVSSPGHVSRTYSASVSPQSPSATVHIEPPELPSTPVASPSSPTVSPVEPTAKPSRPEVATSPVSSPPRERSSAQRWIGVGVGGAGVLGLGIGSTFGFIAKSRLNQSNAGPCDTTNHCTPEGLSTRQDALHAATVSDIAFAAGGVLLAAGIVLYITSPRSASAATGLVVAPVPLASGGGASLSARF